LIAKGHLLLEQAQPEGALFCFLKALRYAEESQSNQLLLQINQALAKIYGIIGEYEREIVHFKSFLKARQVVENDEIQKQIQIIKNRAGIEKAQRDTEKGHSKHIELANAYQELHKVNAEKTSLLERIGSQATQLERLSREDGLTGLANRYYLDNILEQEFKRCQRFNHPFAVALIDIDHFRQLNNRFSRQIGDHVLMVLAKILKKTCRSVDSVGSYVSD